MKKNFKKFLLLFYPLINFFFRRKMREETYLQVAKYGFVASLGTVTNYTIFNILKYLIYGTIISNTISTIITIVETFLLQKFLTFKTKKKYVIELCLFLALASIYYVADTSILIFLIDWIGISSLIGKAVSLIILLPFSFITQKLVVFRKRLN